MNEPWVAIVNPNAGGGKCERDWPQIKAIFNRLSVDYTHIETSRRFHAMVITRKLIRQGYKKFIVVGGDGTLNEVINGVFNQNQVMTQDITIGMIPVGTGNDWARMFSIPTDYEEAVKTLLKEKTFIQDVGRVLFNSNEKEARRYFINIAGIGFDAMVTRKSNKLKDSGRSSKLLYFWNIFIGLFGYRHFHASVNVDGELCNYDIFSMNIGICKYSGGGMKQVPEAIADDGIFDLTIIKRIGKFDVIRSLPKLYNGKIIHHPKVDSLNGKIIRIESPRNIFLETDGESLGHTPFEFTIIPRSIKVVTA